MCLQFQSKLKNVFKRKGLYLDMTNMFCGHISGRMPVKSNRWIFPSKLFLTSIRASLNGFGNITFSKTDLITKPPTPVSLLKDKHIYNVVLLVYRTTGIPSLQNAYITDLITRSPAAMLSSAELDYLKYFCTNLPPSLLRYIQTDRPTNSRACSAALTSTQGNTDTALAQRNSTGPKEARTQHWPKGNTDTAPAQRKHGHSTGPKEALAQRKHRHITGPEEVWTQHWPKGSTDTSLAQRKYGHSTGPEEVWTQHWPKGSTDTSLAQRKYGHSTGPKEAQTALAQRSAVVEKLWGPEEDLVQTTNFINAIKLDVWGQFWNAEEKEEDHKATSDSATAEIHVQHTCTVCLFTKPPTSLPEFLLNVACGCPCGGVIKIQSHIQSSCLMECICQCTTAYSRCPPECLVWDATTITAGIHT